MPGADAFRALTRSSPWRWTTLPFTQRRRHARTWSEPRHAWLRRPDLLRVEDASGRLLDVVRRTPGVSAVLCRSPWDPPPPVGDPVLGADGLVAVRPDGAHLEDPMWQDRWVAELDPAEMADGRDRGSGSPLEIDGLREVEHAGRPAWEALVRPAADYEPRCGCCPLLRSRAADLAEWGPEWLPEAEYPSAELSGSTSEPASACGPTRSTAPGPAMGTTCTSRRSTSRWPTTSSRGCATSRSRPTARVRRRSTSSGGAGSGSGAGADRWTTDVPAGTRRWLT